MINKLSYLLSYDRKSDKFKFTSKGLNKRTIEDTGHEPMSKSRRALDEADNLKSTIRGFKTSNHLVGIYEQAKKISVTFNRKEKYLMMKYILSQRSGKLTA